MISHRSFLCYHFEYANEITLLIAFLSNMLDSISYPLLFI